MWEDLQAEIEEEFAGLSTFDRFARDGFAIYNQRKAPEDPRKVVARSRAWRKANAEKSKAADRARYLKNKAERIAAARAYYAANREAILAKKAVQYRAAKSCKLKR